MQKMFGSSRRLFALNSMSYFRGSAEFMSWNSFLAQQRSCTCALLRLEALSDIFIAGEYLESVLHYFCSSAFFPSFFRFGVTFSPLMVFLSAVRICYFVAGIVRHKTGKAGGNLLRNIKKKPIPMNLGRFFCHGPGEIFNSIHNK